MNTEKEIKQIQSDDSNEALALRIRAGEQELFPVLWERNCRLLTRFAYQYYAGNRKLCEASGIDEDDLQQVCMLALWGAVGAYREGQGWRLTSYFRFQIRSCFAEMLGRNRDPMLDAVRLEQDVGKSDGERRLQLADCLEDTKADDALQAVERSEWEAALHTAFTEALNVLPARQRTALVGLYIEYTPAQELAAALGCTLRTVYALAERGKMGVRRWDARNGDRIRDLLSGKNEKPGGGQKSMKR